MIRICNYFQLGLRGRLFSRALNLLPEHELYFPYIFSPLLDFILIIDIYSTFTLPHMKTKQAVKSINKEILLSIAIAYAYSTTESQPSHEWSRLLFSYVDLQCSLTVLTIHLQVLNMTIMVV